MMNLILTSILRPVLEMDSLSRLFPLSRELILMELVLPSTLVTTLRPKSLMLSSTTTRTELRLPSLLPKTLNLLLSPVSSMMRIELLLPWTVTETSLLHGSVLLEMIIASPPPLHPTRQSILSGRMLTGPQASTCLLMELILQEPMSASREKLASKEVWTYLDSNWCWIQTTKLVCTWCNFMLYIGICQQTKQRTTRSKIKH